MLIDQIQSDLKRAQLDRNEIKVSTLRLALSEIKNAEIAKGGQTSDHDIVSVIQKEAKKRKEAIEAFKIGGREDQVEKEQLELKILEGYLPDQMQDKELTKIVNDIINGLSVKDISNMGQVIGAVMDKVSGRAEGTRVSALVKERLLSS